MHPIRVLLLVLGLAACAGPRSPATVDTPPTTPLARAAYAEWEAWGRTVIVGWPDVRPANTSATPERFDMLLSYWNTLPGGWRIAQQLANRRAGLTALEQRINAELAGEGEDGGPVGAPPVIYGLDDIAYYDYPAWSAAFISSVARRAGVPESDLPSSSRHARYIDAVITRAYSDPEHAAYLPQAPEDYAPVDGDLLCADRAYVRLPHWTARIAERGSPRPMHCDVVIRTRDGYVEAIGGNVQGMVALRRFPVDGQGRVLPAPYGRPSFIVILAARREVAPVAAPVTAAQ